MSNILQTIEKPSLIWIEGRCYRSDDPYVSNNSFQEHDLYENEVLYNEECDEDEDVEDIEIISIDNTRYKASFHVSKHYFGAIIGKKGAVRMRIQRDTRTEIKIPRQGQNGDIELFGPSMMSVKTAYRRINQVVKSSRLKQKPTHFISIPMNSPTIVENFNKFKEAILREISTNGLDETVFIAAQKLHITINVMCLMDNEERMFASKLLTEAKDSIVMPILREHLPLKIRLKGLNYMGDEPKRVNVLYGCIEEQGASIDVIQRMADALAESFGKHGFTREQQYLNTVFLHVTLLNTRYKAKALEANGEYTPTERQRFFFDATDILEKFGDYDFGLVEVTEIHLSQMNKGNEITDQYYNSTCVISLK